MKIECPKCKTRLYLTPQDYYANDEFDCPECGNDLTHDVNATFRSCTLQFKKNVDAAKELGFFDYTIETTPVPVSNESFAKKDNNSTSIKVIQSDIFNRFAIYMFLFKCNIGPIKAKETCMIGEINLDSLAYSGLSIEQACCKRIRDELSGSITQKLTISLVDCIDESSIRFIKFNCVKNSGADKEIHRQLRKLGYEQVLCTTSLGKQRRTEMFNLGPNYYDIIKTIIDKLNVGENEENKDDEKLNKDVKALLIFLGCIIAFIFICMYIKVVLETIAIICCLVFSGFAGMAKGKRK